MKKILLFLWIILSLFYANTFASFSLVKTWSLTNIYPVVDLPYWLYGSFWNNNNFQIYSKDTNTVISNVLVDNLIWKYFILDLKSYNKSIFISFGHYITDSYVSYFVFDKNWVVSSYRYWTRYWYNNWALYLWYKNNSILFTDNLTSNDWLVVDLSSWVNVSRSSSIQTVLTNMWLTNNDLISVWTDFFDITNHFNWTDTFSRALLSWNYVNWVYYKLWSWINDEILNLYGSKSFVSYNGSTKISSLKKKIDSITWNTLFIWDWYIRYKFNDIISSVYNWAVKWTIFYHYLDKTYWILSDNFVYKYILDYYRELFSNFVVSWKYWYIY